MGSAISCFPEGNVETTDSINTTNNDNNRADEMFARSSNSSLANRDQSDDETEEIAIDEAEKISEKIDKDEKDQFTKNDRSNHDDDSDDDNRDNNDDDSDNSDNNDDDDDDNSDDSDDNDDDDDDDYRDSSDDDDDDDIDKSDDDGDNSDDDNELELFTPEELADFKKTKIIGKLKIKMENALACDPRKEEDGTFVVEIRKTTLKVYQGISSLQSGNEEENDLYQLDRTKLIIETKFIDLMHEICAWTFKNGWHDEDTVKQDKKYKPLRHTLVALELLTHDGFEFFATEVASRPKMLQEFTSLIVKYTDRHLGKVEPNLEGRESKVFLKCVSIIHNLSMVESNVIVLREAGLIDIMQPLLKSPTEIVSILALATLAGIINEQECDIINGNKEIVVLLLDKLRKGLKEESHLYKGWSCKECTFTIRMLARNDANKTLLVYLGALQFLVNLGKIGNMDEKYQSAEAIWALSFDEGNHSLITGNADLGVIEILMELKQEDCDKIKKACNGALWNMKEALRCTKIEKYREIGEKLNAQREVPDSARIIHHKKKTARKETEEEERTSKLETNIRVKHIMISYQWSDQAILKDIRDELKACGYKVWMDIDNMVGSTVESMAHAVEGADIVLMCMSSKYKISLPCRAEAEYAYKTKKKIIPLKMEQGYDPDGWLGFILGTKLFFEFSGKYPFKKKMDELLKAISAERKKTDSTDGGDIIIPSEIEM